MFNKGDKVRYRGNLESLRGKVGVVTWVGNLVLVNFDGYKLCVPFNMIERI